MLTPIDEEKIITSIIYMYLLILLWSFTWKSWTFIY